MPAKAWTYRGFPLRSDLWRVPLAMCGGAVVLFLITIGIDSAAAHQWIALPAWLSIGGIDDARAILGAMLGAVSTVLALIFSVALLVLSMAANMLGQRLMYRFIRDGITQVTIGLFLATFLQILLTFVVTRGGEIHTFVPQVTLLTSVLLTCASFGCLVVYSHRVAMSIQTDNVVARIVADLDRLLIVASHSWSVAARQARPISSQPSSGGDYAALWRRCIDEGGHIVATQSGYLERIRYDALITAAEQAEAVVRLAYRPGEFVMKGSVLAYVLPADRAADLTNAVVEAVSIGKFRTLEQDLEFAIAQLVEIALRALSPAINDTFTGIRCVDRLGDALREFAGIPTFDGVWRTPAGTMRLLERPMQFPWLVKAAFDKIRQAAVGTPAVMIRMLETCARLAPFLTMPEHRKALLDQVEAIWESAAGASLVRVDRADVEAAYRTAQKALAA